MDDPHTLLGSTDLAVDLHGGRTDPFIPFSKEGSVLSFSSQTAPGEKTGGRMQGLRMELLQAFPPFRT